MNTLVFNGCSSANDDSSNRPNNPAVLPGVITRDNHIDLLNEVFSLFVGEFYNSELKNLGFDFLDQYEPDPPPSTTSCSNGGTALFEYSSPLHFNFKNCQVGDNVYDGEISQLQNVLRNGIGIDTSQFTIKRQPDTTLRFSGDGRRLYSRTTADYVNVWWVEDWSISNEDPARTFDVFNAAYSFRYGYDSTSQLNFIARMTGSLSWRSSLTRQNTVRATVLEDLIYPSTDGLAEANWNFTQGALQLLAEDGSALVLNADTGDSETVLIELTIAGQSESFIQPWSLWQPILRFADYSSPVDR